MSNKDTNIGYGILEGESLDVVNSLKDAGLTHELDLTPVMLDEAEVPEIKTTLGYVSPGNNDSRFTLAVRPQNGLLGQRNEQVVEVVHQALANVNSVPSLQELVSLHNGGVADTNRQIAQHSEVPAVPAQDYIALCGSLLKEAKADSAIAIPVEEKTELNIVVADGMSDAVTALMAIPDSSVLQAVSDVQPDGFLDVEDKFFESDSYQNAKDASQDDGLVVIPRDLEGNPAPQYQAMQATEIVLPARQGHSKAAYAGAILGGVVLAGLVVGSAAYLFHDDISAAADKRVAATSITAPAKKSTRPVAVPYVREEAKDSTRRVGSPVLVAAVDQAQAEKPARVVVQVKSAKQKTLEQMASALGRSIQTNQDAINAAYKHEKGGAWKSGTIPTKKQANGAFNYAQNSWKFSLTDCRDRDAPFTALDDLVQTVQQAEQAPVAVSQVQPVKKKSRLASLGKGLRRAAGKVGGYFSRSKAEPKSDQIPVATTNVQPKKSGQYLGADEGTIVPGSQLPKVVLADLSRPSHETPVVDNGPKELPYQPKIYNLGASERKTGVAKPAAQVQQRKASRVAAVSRREPSVAVAPDLVEQASRAGHPVTTTGVKQPTVVVEPKYKQEADSVTSRAKGNSRVVKGITSVEVSVVADDSGAGSLGHVCNLLQKRLGDAAVSYHKYDDALDQVGGRSTVIIDPAYQAKVKDVIAMAETSEDKNDFLHEGRNDSRTDFMRAAIGATYNCEIKTKGKLVNNRGKVEVPVVMSLANMFGIQGMRPRDVQAEKVRMGLQTAEEKSGYGGWVVPEMTKSRTVDPTDSSAQAPSKGYKSGSETSMYTTPRKSCVDDVVCDASEESWDNLFAAIDVDTRRETMSSGLKEFKVGEYTETTTGRSDTQAYAGNQEVDDAWDDIFAEATAEIEQAKAKTVNYEQQVGDFARKIGVSTYANLGEQEITDDMVVEVMDEVTDDMILDVSDGNSPKTPPPIPAMAYVQRAA